VRRRTSCCTESASASIAITFSSIFSKATTALEVLSEPSISCTCLEVLALAARAFSVSFLLLASISLASGVWEGSGFEGEGLGGGCGGIWRG